MSAATAPISNLTPADVPFPPIATLAAAGDARAGSSKFCPVRRELQRRIISLQRLRLFAFSCESVAQMLKGICPMRSKASSLVKLVLSTAYATSVEQ